MAAHFCKGPEVRRHIAGIVLKIRLVVELQGVDENTGANPVIFRQGLAYQGEVALMQSTHCRHKAYAETVGSLVLAPCICKGGGRELFQLISRFSVGEQVHDAMGVINQVIRRPVCWNFAGRKIAVAYRDGFHSGPLPGFNIPAVVTDIHRFTR